MLVDWVPLRLACVPLFTLACAGGCKGDANPSNPAEVPRFSSDTCEAPPRPVAAVDLKQVFLDLAVQAPVGLVQAPRQAGEARGRWFIIDQHGLVHSFHERADGNVEGLVTSDLRDRVQIRDGALDERGLLGIALHPRFPHDARVFLAYTATPEGRSGTESRVSSFRVAEGRIDASSEVVLIRVDQPYTNHNGGDVAFGLDGFLYASLGDGGSGGDPQNHGQNTDTLLGSILRIDVDRQQDSLPYAIPSDNPFVGGGGLPEIYAYGLRNAWRFSFDRDTGEIWAGDVGQDEWEEITLIEKGGNHGWKIREGFECYPPSVTECQSEGLVPPVHAYQHPPVDGRSVTGGFVYRGSRLPELVGRYVFGEFVTGEMWQLNRSGDGVEVTSLLRTNAQIASFATDHDGELYVLDYAGRVLRVEPNQSQSALPALLSDTGCVDQKNPSQLASNLVPYDVALPFWSDGVQKERYLMVPAGKKLRAGPDGDLEVPEGTVVVKNFRQGDRLFETRFYVRHTDGEYSGYSYAWRADGSDAELVEETRVEKIGDLDWVFPGRGDCNRCHTAAAGRTLGLELRQLDITTDDGEQMRRLEDHLEGAPTPLEAFPALADTAASLEVRARAYLHVNCSTCHRPGAPARGGLDLRFDTALVDTGLCDAAELGVVGTADGWRIAPGDPEQSVLHARISRRDESGMPPLASNLVDREGVEAIERWIESLPSCP